MESLQDCFEHTDWDMFQSAAEDIIECAVCVWVHQERHRRWQCGQKDLHTSHWGILANQVLARLKTQNDAFKSDDMVALKTARANLNYAIKLTKHTHGKKVQDIFQAAHKHWKIVAEPHTPPGRKTSALLTIWKKLLNLFLVQMSGYSALTKLMSWGRLASKKQHAQTKDR